MELCEFGYCHKTSSLVLYVTTEEFGYCHKTSSLVLYVRIEEAFRAENTNTCDYLKLLMYSQKFKGVLTVLQLSQV
jgi:hypothetical protein